MLISWFNSLLFFIIWFHFRNAVMVVTSNCAHQKRKGRGRTLLAHISGHYPTQAANRRRCSKRFKQICPFGTIGNAKSFGVGITIFVPSSRDQNGRNQTIIIGTSTLLRQFFCLCFHNLYISLFLHGFSLPRYPHPRFVVIVVCRFTL